MIQRHKTAITRYKLSKPVEQAISDLVIRPGMSVFDYGCGKGGDIKLLRQAGYACSGWDPAFARQEPKTRADIVNLGYIVNVIENPQERQFVLLEALSLANKCLIVSAQMSLDPEGPTGEPFGDGIITRWGTFQKFFHQDELRKFIHESLGIEPVAAGVGVFYIFQSVEEHQSFLLRRVQRRRIALPRRTVSLEEKLAPHRELLEAFADAVETLGRIPRPEEFPSLEQLRESVGTPARCVKLCEQLFPEFDLETVRRTHREDLLVYIALSRFKSRPQFSALPETLQWDIRDWFGSYSKACDLADDLLFQSGDVRAFKRACEHSSVGKLLPQALYVHSAALSRLDPLLRIYLGCGEAVLGTIPEANIFKIPRVPGRISYLSYPDFDRKAHPKLVQSITLDLRTRDITKRSFAKSSNPPVLHRKETFVSSDYPLYDQFAKLSAKEEECGLLRQASRIGLFNGWEARLRERGFLIRGNQLCVLRTGNHG